VNEHGRVVNAGHGKLAGLEAADVEINLCGPGQHLAGARALHPDAAAAR